MPSPVRVSVNPYNAALPWFAPFRGSSESAAFDIRASEIGVVPPWSTKVDGAPTVVPTNMRLGMPGGYYAQILSRSGLASRGVHVCAGTIDQDYTGEIKVLLENRSSEPFHFKAGDRIAQMAFHVREEVHILEPHFQETEAEQARTATTRGEGGFGSTGM